MKIIKLLPLVFIFSFLISACDTNRVFDQTVSIPDKGWNKDSVLVFNVDIADTLSLNNFYLNIRHNTNYQYSNIFFFINTVFPDGKAGRDTIEILLADKRGNWIGSGIGNIKDNQVMLRKNLRFPEKGIYTFKIQQAMRQDNLTGIEDLGIRIEKTE